MQKKIDKVDDDYVVVFFDTAEEIFGELGAYERQGFAWKGLFYKKKFLE